MNGPNSPSCLTDIVSTYKLSKTSAVTRLFKTKCTCYLKHPRKEKEQKVVIKQVNRTTEDPALV